MADNPTTETAVTPEQSVQPEPEVQTNLLGQFENLITAKNEQPTSTDEQDAQAQPDAPVDELTPDDLELEETDNSPAEGTEELITIKVDGRDQQVTLEELKNGYSRQSDYSKKTQILADERRGLDTERNQINTEKEAVQKERDAYANKLKAYINSEKKDDDTNWDEVYNRDPIEYVRLKAEADKKKEVRQQAEAELKEIETKQKEEQEKKYKEYVTTQANMLSEKVPEFADPVKKGNLQVNIKNYLNEIGFSDQELSMLTDHRTFMVAIEGMKYNQLKKAKLGDKKVKNIPKVSKSGIPTSKDDASFQKRREVMKRAKSGKSGDMLEAFMNVIN
tara:strand:+ start:176 stop:1177 length:1002 start_codon:yes stop_codon:yes gene_type:complete